MRKKIFLIMLAVFVSLCFGLFCACGSGNDTPSSDDGTQTENPSGDENGNENDKESDRENGGQGNGSGYGDIELPEVPL